MRSLDALKTDLYELTMAAGYFRHRHNPQAVFELYCHTLPPERAYLIACGLEQVLDYILGLRFVDRDIRYLKSQSIFKQVDPSFFRFLKKFKFSGDVWAMPEGEICFANEPILQVRAPLIEAQILETYLLSMINIQTLVASKAARIMSAAERDGQERPVVDFGSRRAHGPEAGMLAARAATVGGCLGTSNVEAARRYGLRVFGTMAHSWVESYETETLSFEKFNAAFPEHTILLVDTYDTLKGVQKAIDLGRDIRGIRLDSGDLRSLSFKTRRLLDKNGLHSVKILASGNLNEFKIRKLVDGGCPIDIFGVGTEMVVSRDLPALDLTYKLVQTRPGRGRVRYHMKTSAKKHTIPGRKQVYRFFERNGLMRKDIVGLFGERTPRGACPLLKEYIRRGKRVKPSLPAETLKETTAKRLKRLPDPYHELKAAGKFPVTVSRRLGQLTRAESKNKGG